MYMNLSGGKEKFIQGGEWAHLNLLELRRCKKIFHLSALNRKASNWWEFFLPRSSFSKFSRFLMFFFFFHTTMYFLFFFIASCSWQLYNRSPLIFLSKTNFSFNKLGVQIQISGFNLFNHLLISKFFPFNVSLAKKQTWSLLRPLVLRSNNSSLTVINIFYSNGKYTEEIFFPLARVTSRFNFTLHLLFIYRNETAI